MALILVTGGSGFVGREVVKSLIDAGHSVRLVSRQSSTPFPNVELCRTRDLFAANENQLELLLTGIDCVVHLGWYVDPSDYLVSDKNWDCLSGSIRLGLVAKRMNIKHFVGIGTCIEYESTNEIRKISTPLRPETSYGAAKTSLYFALTQIFKDSDTRFAWCRLFFLHGESQDPSRCVPQIRSSISQGVIPVFEDSNEERDYLHVSEASRMIATVVNKRLSGAFNVCSGKPISSAEIFFGLAAKMGRFDLVELFKQSPTSRNLSKPRKIVGEPSTELMV